MLKHFLDDLLYVLGLRLRERAEQSGRLGSAGDDQLLSLGHLVEQFGEMRPGFLDPDRSHRYSIE